MAKINKHWFIQIPIMLFFVGCYCITEMGWQGQLDNLFLREKVYPALSRASNFLTDIKFKTRGVKLPKNKVVILEIDSPALEALGRWPWHRDVMAYLVDKVFVAGAKVVGLDIVYSEADLRVPKELAELLKEKNLGDLGDKFETDRQLEEVIKRNADSLVLAWTTEQSCQPAFDEAKYCPVADPAVTGLYPPDFNKFSLQEFKTTRPFDPAQVPLVSFVTPITNIQPYHAAAQHLGYLNAFLDPDGAIRKTSLIVFANGLPYPSLPLEMLRTGLKERIGLKLDHDERVAQLTLLNSGRIIPVSPLGALQINFRGPGAVFNHVSALDMMSEKDTLDDPVNQKLTGKSKVEILKDAYVLIGVSAIGVYDMRQFPFESNAPGVEGHANLLDNLLTGDPMIHNTELVGSEFMIALMLLGVGFLAYGIGKLDATRAILLFVGTLLVLAYVDVRILFEGNQNWNTIFLYFEIVMVFIMIFAAKYLQEEQDKKFIRGAFSKYVAPLIVDSILKDPTKLTLGGEKREMSILFSDIRGFTTFSEKMDAKALASFLNDYLGIMTKIVFANRGTLDKYIGDAVMAFWGAPLEDPHHAYHACCAAKAMAKALADNRERFRTQYGIEVNSGIGVNSGVVNVGNMGSDTNFEYTVIGDHVNLASRVEGITKEYGVEIITTKFTYDCVVKSGKEFLPNRVLDDVKVKGKKTAVELIELIPEGFSTEALQLFNEGRALYHDRKWDEAIAKFEAADRLLSPEEGTHDGPCETYLERCRKFKFTPPEADWDGSWKMETK